MRAVIRSLDKGIIAPLAAALAMRRRHRNRAPEHGPRVRRVAIKLVGMGDAVLMLPALAALRAQGGPLTVITTNRCAAIFGAPGVADEVLVLRRTGMAATLAAIARALRRADVVLDFEQHVYWSALLAAGARGAATRLGLRTRNRARNRVYDQLVASGEAPRPMKEIFDDLARLAGATPQSGLLALPLRAAAVARIDEWRRRQHIEAGGYTVIAPGSGGTVPFRRLSAAQWAPVVRDLAARGPVVLVGTSIEAGIIAEIEQQAGVPLVRETGLPLEQFAALLAGARAVLAIDSGPMHLAAAMGVPVVGIFGPDTPARYAPYSPRAQSVWLGLACSPCNNCFVYREAQCVNPQRYACIAGITPEMVLEAEARISN